MTRKQSSRPGFPQQRFHPIQHRVPALSPCSGNRARCPVPRSNVPLKEITSVLQKTGWDNLSRALLVDEGFHLLEDGVPTDRALHQVVMGAQSLGFADLVVVEEAAEHDDLEVAVA